MVNTFLTQPPTSRVGRYPKHTFNTVDVPYFARPFMIAPVLPAETLQSIYMETRVITDPIVNPIIGWKKEYFFFYVKISDLLEDSIKQMFIDPDNGSLPGAAASYPNLHYAANGGYQWLEKSMMRIMKHYFWDEGHDLSSTFPENDWGRYAKYPVYVRDVGIFDSITDKDEMPEGDAISGATSAQDLEALMTAFEHLRAMGMANMSYEDFLRTYGVSIKDPTEGKPELLWHLADWQYPSNTIDPSTGKPTSAVSWVFRQSTRDKKFFTEPGFIVGLTVTRPKVYLGLQAGYASGFLQRAWDWMPALLASMPETRLKEFAAGAGPLVQDPGGETPDLDKYWLDMCDLFVHGDQFIEEPFKIEEGIATLVPGSNAVQLPRNFNGVIEKRQFLAPFEAISFFAKEAVVLAGDPGSQVRQDGMVSLSIKGKQIDLTQTAGFEQGV